MGSMASAQSRIVATKARPGERVRVFFGGEHRDGVVEAVAMRDLEVPRFAVRISPGWVHTCTDEAFERLPECMQ